MGKTLTAKEFYAGHDPGTGFDFAVEPGESVEVSDEKFEQLERDGLLQRFEVGKAKGSAKESDLGKLKVLELQEKAKKLGIDTEDGDGKDLTKAKLIAAIKAKQSSPSDELDELDRDQLIALATETGIGDPGDLEDEEIRNAILSARGGN